VIAALKRRMALDTCLSHPEIDRNYVLGNIFTRHCCFWTISYASYILVIEFESIGEDLSDRNNIAPAPMESNRYRKNETDKMIRLREGERVPSFPWLQVAETAGASVGVWTYFSLFIDFTSRTSGKIKAWSPLCGAHCCD
jgi:hypothetical protein